MPSLGHIFFIRLPIVVDKDYPVAKGHGQDTAMDPVGLLYVLLCTMLNAIRQILLRPATHSIWRYIAPDHAVIPAISHRSPVPILRRWRLTSLCRQNKTIAAETISVARSHHISVVICDNIPAIKKTPRECTGVRGLLVHPLLPFAA